MSILYPRRLDVVEMCEEAAERAGIEFRSGYALTSARRSLELLSIDWANRGLNLWCLDRFTLPFLVSGEIFDLPPDTVDVLDVVFLRAPFTGSGIQLERIGLGDVSAYASVQPASFGTVPNSYWVERLMEPPRLHLWPPLSDPMWPSHQLSLWRLRYMQGLKAGGTDTPELPFRLQPAMIAGLAYMMAMKSKDPAVAQRAVLLKQLYEEQFDLAAQEDRDRSDFHFVPDIR